MRNRARARRGFTLVEILLVLGIIVMMAGVAAFVMWPQAKGAKIDVTKVLIASVSDAIEAYNANIGHYPSDEEGGLTALTVKPSFSDETLAEKWRGPYVKQDPKDPWNNKLNYQVAQPGTPEADQTPFKLWSNGPDGVDGTDDDIRNWSDQTTGK
jgi:general secretion pathway protein G